MDIHTKKIKKKRILILDDDQDRIDAFTDLFAGNLIDTCMHADECIRLLKNNVYDAIFLDHDLNGMQIEYDKDDCGSTVADWICEHPISGKVVIHSYNSERAEYMKNVIPGSTYIPGAWLIDVNNSSLLDE
jgi:CheY-like chemotaxis protein